LLNRLNGLNPLNPNTSNNKEMKTVKEMKRAIEKLITGIKNKLGLNGSSTGKDLRAIPIYVKK
jgi:hypothetical protein